MLRVCTKNEFDQYIDFAYGLAMDPEKSGYPTYCDGIKTKDMFVERSLKAFERETEQMLLFEYEGEVQGLIHFYWIPEDRYLQTNCFNINKAPEQALSEFVTYVGERFHGYDLFMGFPAANRTAVQFFSAHGFECIEDDYNNTAFLDRLGEMPVSSSLIRITGENYDMFRRLHSQIEGDMYWDSDRIFEDLDNWIIFVKKQDGKARGAVYLIDIDETWSEIFGIDMDQDVFDPGVFAELLNAALMDAKHRSIRTMTFFCEKEYEEITVKAGFTCIGQYFCHKLRLE